MHLGPKLGERLVLIGVVVGGFGTAVAMVPGGFSPFGPAKAFVLLVGVALIALGFAVDPVACAETCRRAFRQRGVWPALALILLAVISTATSIDPSQSLLGHYPEYRGLALLLAASVVGFGAYALVSDSNPNDPLAWRILGRSAVVVLLVAAAYAGLQFFRLDPFPYARELDVRRVFSTSGNASNFGLILLMLIPLALVRARVERGAWLVLGWVAVAVGAITLAWSLSRGAWAGAVVGALVWAAIEPHSRPKASRWRIALVVLAVGIFALILAIAFVPNAAGRFGAALDPSTGTIGWRAEVWSASAMMVGARPLLGFGPASFRYAFPPRRTASMIGGDSANQIADDPHNILASTALASGVFALAMLIWLIWESIVAAWSFDRAAAAEGAASRGPRGAVRDAQRNAWQLAAPALGAAVAGATTALMFHFATLDAAPMLAAVIGLALGGAQRSEPAERTSPAPASHRSTPAAVTRICAIAVSCVAIASALLALGLIAADIQVARGFALADDVSASWPAAKFAFSHAEASASWEPALTWAAGRAATQRVSAGDATAADDALAALSVASDRLPADPLLVAQFAEAYLVVGQATGDRTAVQRAQELALRAIELDPQNGARWTLEGMVLAALGDTQASLNALQKAVSLAPQDAQAWSALAGIYTRMGDSAKADAARAKADAIGSGL